jgi:hypothetical protein
MAGAVSLVFTHRVFIRQACAKAERKQPQLSPFLPHLFNA